jgi:hypothetical protein
MGEHKRKKFAPAHSLLEDGVRARPMSGQEAAELLGQDPRKLTFTFEGIMRAFGLNEKELLSELRSGRLVAVGSRVDESGTVHDICIRGDHLIKWMALTGRQPNASD